MQLRSSKLKSTFKKISAPLALACALTIAPVAMAKDVSSVPTHQVSVKEQKIMNRLDSIQQSLADIRQQTLEKNPQLMKELEAYETAFKNKVESLGYKPEDLIKRAQEIQHEMSNTDLSTDKRTELVKEFTTIRDTLVKQQETILSDPAISKQDQKVQKDMIDAMQKQDPKTKELLDELNSLVAEFREQN